MTKQLATISPETIAIPNPLSCHLMKQRYLWTLILGGLGLLGSLGAPKTPLGFAGDFLAISILMCVGTAVDALRFQRKK